jgi:hypothetical protein
MKRRTALVVGSTLLALPLTGCGQEVKDAVNQELNGGITRELVTTTQSDQVKELGTTDAGIAALTEAGYSPVAIVTRDGDPTRLLFKSCKDQAGQACLDKVDPTSGKPDVYIDLDSGNPLIKPAGTYALGYPTQVESLAGTALCSMNSNPAETSSGLDSPVVNDFKTIGSVLGGTTFDKAVNGAEQAQTVAGADWNCELVLEVK